MFGGMLIMVTVSLPAAQDGTGTPERVTIMSAGGALGQPGVMVIVEVAFWLCFMSADG
jgi:hypothetical protein